MYEVCTLGMLLILVWATHVLPSRFALGGSRLPMISLSSSLSGGQVHRS